MTLIKEWPINPSTWDKATNRWTDMVKRWTWIHSTEHDDTPPHMSLTTELNDHNASGAEVSIPGSHEELWLQYDVFFSGEEILGKNEKAHSVGFKMPGLGSSGPHVRMNGNYTGGNHSSDGFSGRLMGRAHQSEGRSWVPGDGMTIGLYAYDLQLAQDPNQKYGRDFIFLRRNEVNPPRRGSVDINGTGPGSIGDSDAWIAPYGEWITFTLGYKVGKTNNFFEAWSSSESDPMPRRRLRLDGDGFWWMAQTARQTIDTLLMQSYWGGPTDPIWLPDERGEIAYSPMRIYDSNPLEDTQPIDSGNHGVETGMGGTMSVTVHAYGDTGTEELELHVDGEPCPRRFVVSQGEPGNEDHFTWDNIKSTNDISVCFVNDGDDANNVNRNLQVMEVEIADGGATVTVGMDHPGVVSNAYYPRCGEITTGDIHKGWMHCNGFIYLQGALGLPAPPDPVAEPTAQYWLDQIKRAASELREML